MSRSMAEHMSWRQKEVPVFADTRSEWVARRESQPPFSAPNYSTHVPSNFPYNSFKTNDWGTHQVTLKSWYLRPGSFCGTAPTARFQRQFTRHTLPSNFRPKPLKTKERCTRQVTHFSRTGLPVSTQTRAPGSTANRAREIERAWDIKGLPVSTASRVWEIRRDSAYSFRHLTDGVVQ